MDLLERRDELSPLLCVRQPRKEQKEQISNTDPRKWLFKENGISLAQITKQLMPQGTLTTTEQSSWQLVELNSRTRKKTTKEWLGIPNAAPREEQQKRLQTLGTVGLH